MDGARKKYTPQSGSISTTLLEQIRAHQPLAWERLVRLYSPLIYRWCRRAGVPPEDAADLLQDVFAAVMRYLPGFRREETGGGFTAWLATITRNKIRDYYRRRPRLPRGRGGTTAQKIMAEIPQDDASPESAVGVDAATSALLSQRLLHLIQSEFERRTWQAFEQTAMQSRKAADVAHDLGMSTAAVYMAKSRVLRRLREILADLES